MQSIILHLDMNSYFASVEQQDNPVWRGKVLGVCEHLGGIIIAASIEAKKWGIKTGTPVWEAKKIYPKIILTHTRAEAYRDYNRKFVKVVSDYTDKVEVYSIDEAFLDITRICNIRNSKFEYQNSKKNPNFKIQKLCNNHLSTIAGYADPFYEAASIAKEIKQRMKKEVGDYLTCSIGIGENKLLAKIASDLQKPDGLVIIAENQNEKIKMKNLGVFSFAKNELYNFLKLIDIPGIGRRQEKNLNELGIKTLLDLKNYPQSRLVARFGIIGGRHLYNMGQLEGSFKPQVHQEKEIKSMGHMYTLPQEYRKPEFFEPVLYKLCEMVARRLRRKNLRGKRLFVHAHDLSEKCFSKAEQLKFSLTDGREIFLHSQRIFKKMGVDCIACKLVGVTVGELYPQLCQQSLFGDEERNKRLLLALDKINGKYGEFTIARLEAMLAGKVFRDSVGFGRIKELN
jgi:DNA polymerase IV